MTAEQADLTTATPDAILSEAGVVSDYGDVAAEYRAVREGAGVVDRTDLAHLVLSGRDPVRMVQGLITNDLVAAGVERAVYGAMLTPKGRTIAELRAVRIEGADGTEVWLDLPREVLAAASTHLRRSVPPLYARWRDASAEVGLLGVYGPGSARALAAVLGQPIAELEEDMLATVDYEGRKLRIIGTRYAGGEPGFDLLLESELISGLRDRLLASGGGVRRAGFSALEMLRIEAGRPRGGRELTEESIPTEVFEPTGLMERAISFGKGCYTGQEVIVRIAHRGHVNRHLRGLIFPEEGDSASPGTRIHHLQSGKDIGWIASVAPSPLLRTTVALAFVRREVEPTDRVRVGGADGFEAEVSALPFRPKAPVT